MEVLVHVQGNRAPTISSPQHPPPFHFKAKDTGATPLMTAVSLGDARLVQALLERVGICGWEWMGEKSIH